MASIILLVQSVQFFWHYLWCNIVRSSTSCVQQSIILNKIEERRNMLKNMLMQKVSILPSRTQVPIAKLDACRQEVITLIC